MLWETGLTGASCQTRWPIELFATGLVLGGAGKRKRHEEREQKAAGRQAGHQRKEDEWILQKGRRAVEGDCHASPESGSYTMRWRSQMPSKRVQAVKTHAFTRKEAENGVFHTTERCLYVPIVATSLSFKLCSRGVLFLSFSCHPRHVHPSLQMFKGQPFSLTWVSTKHISSFCLFLLV